MNIKSEIRNMAFCGIIFTLSAVFCQQTATAILPVYHIQQQPADTVNKDSNFTTTEIEPDPDEFTPCEKEPFVDLGALQKLVVYPEEAKRDGIEGLVFVRALINKEGVATKHRIDHSTNTVLNKAAIDAVMNMKYKPAIQKGKQIFCWISIPITFKLR